MLMYLVLSLICTALQEWVAKIFELRSNNLETGLKSLMSDELARDFLQSPQLIGLKRGSQDDVARAHQVEERIRYQQYSGRPLHLLPVQRLRRFGADGGGCI